MEFYLTHFFLDSECMEIGQQGDIISDNTQQPVACAVPLFMFAVKDQNTGVYVSICFYRKYVLM